MVRSQAERQIADYFYANRIKYSYEDQAKTSRTAFREKISKPDFYLSDYGAYVEYWGLIDVGDWQTRNRYRDTMKLKMKEYETNEIRFISLFPWHLNDLDMAFKAEFKKVMGKDLIVGPVGEKSVYALPISPHFERELRSGVSSLLEMEVRILYSPYFFVEYDCFTQGTFFYERVNLASRGILVLEGNKGVVVDIQVQSGEVPNIAHSGAFVDCFGIQPVEIPRSKIASGVAMSRVEDRPARITKYDAEKIAKVEIAKNLKKELSRDTGQFVETKTLIPYESNVRVVSVKMSYIPVATAIFRYKNRVYCRVMQSTTNRIMGDDLTYCNVGVKHWSNTVLVCEECGILACESHRKLCITCHRNFCNVHILSKGLISKKYYCRDHFPQ